MLKILKQIFEKPNGLKNIETPQDLFVEFGLYYGDLIIGKLILKDGEWKFKYSNKFIEQNEISPLTDFPKKDKEYFSKSLWPFFVSRIPSLERPEIKYKIIKNKINEDNEVELLKYFGKKSISNPFTLLPTTN